MLRGPGEPANLAKHPKSRQDETALRAKNLSPAKRRVAEALAALLVAHYRREHERPDPNRERVPRP